MVGGRRPGSESAILDVPAVEECGAAMTTTDDALSNRWQELIGALDELDVHGGSDAPDAGDLGRELIARYREPHRHYHTAEHLLAVLEALDELTGTEGPTAAQRLAAWFHDAVYTGSTPADEDASADLAEARLAPLGLHAGLVARVAAMVRATARHLDPSADHDPETAAFLDADLAILAAPAGVYDAYAAGVRREHPSIPDDAFRLGRAAVLEALLTRERLYLTPTGHARFDAPARANLSRELTTLRPTP